MVGSNQFWYIDQCHREWNHQHRHQQHHQQHHHQRHPHQHIEDENLPMAQYEDTTKLYDIINHYADDEILTVEITENIKESVAITNERQSIHDISDNSVNEDVNESKKEDVQALNVENDSLEECKRIFLTGHPGDILGQIYDDNLGILYNIYRLEHRLEL